MLKEFKLEDPGEGIHEVEINEVLVSAGDAVEDGQTVFVVESDKAAIELPSPYDGTVKEVTVGEGDTVEVGAVLMTVETEADSAEAENEESEAGAADAEGAEEGKDAGEAEEAEVSEDAEEKDGEERDEKAAASREEGADGEDEERESEETGRGRDKAAEGKAKPDRPIKAAPAARKLAKDKGVDLSEVEAGGSKGHVTREDVERHLEAGEDTKPAKKERPSQTAELPDFSQFGPVRREPLRSIRKATAKHMAKAWSEIPHVLLMDRFDLTELERFRRRHKDDVADQGGSLTLTVFTIKAAAVALAEHPRFNASLDMSAEEIVEKDYYNIGVALDSERGLIVPVLRDVDQKSVADIAVELKDLGERVRDGQASKEDLSGGTFSITNVGALGGEGFFPIINHPEAAIIGTGRGSIEPVVVGDLDNNHIEARFIVPISLSFDHRINDGADAARFLDTFRTVLTDPEQFALKA